MIVVDVIGSIYKHLTTNQGWNQEHRQDIGLEKYGVETIQK
jgi:hypothetical protein